jgi:hypothetical protein
VCAASDVQTNEDVATLLSIIVRSSSVNSEHESLGVRVCGLPAGSSLSVVGTPSPGPVDSVPGCMCFGACPGAEMSLEDFQAALARLVFTPAQDAASSIPVALNVTCTSSRNGSVAESATSFDVLVQPMPDVPTLVVESASRSSFDNATTPVPLVIHVTLNDVDGSETGVVRISNVPSGITLSAGSKHDGMMNDSQSSHWILRLDELADLELVGLNSEESLQLNVTAISTEQDDDSGEIASASSILEVFAGTIHCANHCMPHACDMVNTCHRCRPGYVLNSAMQCQLAPVDSGECLSIVVPLKCIGKVVAVSSDSGPYECLCVQYSRDADPDIDCAAV